MLGGLFPRVMRPGVPLAVQRYFLRLLTAVATFAPRGLRRQRLQLGGVPAECTRPRSGDDKVGVLYLHGGAFVSGSAATHRAITGHLARALGGPVYAVDYRLAPEATAPAPLEDALAAWQTLLAQGWRAGQMAVAGDSAGGNLALQLALRLAFEGLDGPAAVLALSPWVDLGNRQLTSVEGGDPLLTRGWLDLGSRLYRGSHSADDPQVSPLYGDLTLLPPTLIQAGSEEILLADAERLLAIAREQQAPVELEVYRKYWHVFQVHAGLLTASSAAIDSGARFIRRHCLSAGQLE
jgi:monoterpene epsilon-lactone hydrolase